jgi:tyrosyl-tRNA synthetase
MLDREAVAARLAGSGISYTEFSYVLLQSNDYLELFRRFDCRLQLGGSDQWGNITAGI